MPAVADDADQAEKHFQDGKGFFEKGQYERASYHLDKAYRLSGKWQYLEYIAKTWLALENFENASYALDAYLRKGGSVVPAAKKAWATKELDRIGKAKEYQANKQEADAHFKKGSDLYSRKEYEKAAIELEQAYDLNPSWEFLELIGRTETALKNYDRAVEAFEKFLAESGEKATGAQRNAVKKALEDVQALVGIEQDKEEALSHFETGKKQLDKGDYEKAVKTLELAYRLYPDWKFLEPLGEALAGSHSYRRAADAFTAFLQKGAANVPAKRRTELTDEIARLTKLATEDQNVQQSKSLEQRGLLLMKDGQHAKALAQLQQAYELDPNIGLFVSMAQANDALGRFQEAVGLYERYLKEAGSGVPQSKRDEIEGAIAVLKKKIEVEAERARAMTCFKLGVTFYEQGMFEKAAIEFNKAYEIDPNYQILPRIAETEAELKNYDLAVRKLEQYLADGGDQISKAQRSDTEKRIAYFKALAGGKAPSEAGVTAAAVQDEYGKHGAEEETDEVPRPGKGEVDAALAAKEQSAASPKEEKEPYDWDPKKRLWTWVVGGVGVAGFLGAIATGAIANSENKKIDDLCPGGECPPEYQAGAEDRVETVNTLRRTTTALVIVGAVGVAAGITLFFVEPLMTKKQEQEPQVSLAPLLDGENVGLVVLGRF